MQDHYPEEAASSEPTSPNALSQCLPLAASPRKRSFEESQEPKTAFLAPNGSDTLFASPIHRRADPGPLSPFDELHRSGSDAFGGSDASEPQHVDLDLLLCDEGSYEDIWDHRPKLPRRWEKDIAARPALGLTQKGIRRVLSLSQWMQHASTGDQPETTDTTAASEGLMEVEAGFEGPPSMLAEEELSLSDSDASDDEAATLGLRPNLVGRESFVERLFGACCQKLDSAFLWGPATKTGACALEGQQGSQQASSREAEAVKPRQLVKKGSFSFR